MAGRLPRRLGRQPLPDPPHRLPGVQESVDARLLRAGCDLAGDPLRRPVGAEAAARSMLDGAVPVDDRSPGDRRSPPTSTLTRRGLRHRLGRRRRGGRQGAGRGRARRRAARAGRALHQGRLHPARRRDDAAALRGHGAARDGRPDDHHPAGPQHRRLDRAQPLLLLPHARADSRASGSARPACATCRAADLLPSFERVERC